MFASLALAAAVLFVVLVIARLRGSGLPVLGIAVAVAGALAAVFALVHWSSTGDSRWMVGAILMAGGLALSLIRGNRPLTIAAIVLGLLGVGLFGVAFANPMRQPPAAAVG